MNLLEGGNVFKDANGQPLTGRINQADVPKTIAWVEKVTGIEFPKERWLGSTGRKATSGDLDLAVDISEVSKEALAAHLSEFITSQGFDPRDFVRKGGEVHLKTPIGGNAKNGYVQTDFMFFPNLDWGTFFYAGGEDSVFKGMNRNVLMSSIAKQLGLKVGANGMLSRSSNLISFQQLNKFRSSKSRNTHIKSHTYHYIILILSNFNFNTLLLPFFKYSSNTFSSNIHILNK